MRTAVLSDIHGNAAALRAVAADLAGADIDRVAFAGDLVAFGPEPAECIDLLRSFDDLVAIAGNADRYVFEGRPDFAWWAEAVGPDRLDWLRRLPGTADLPEHATLVVHATPTSDEDVVLPDTPDEEVRGLIGAVAADTMVYGHVHLQHVRMLGELRILNPGSVGLPFDGDQRAAWAILDGTGAELRRTAYDVEAVIADLERRSVPDIERTAGRLRRAAA